MVAPRSPGRQTRIALLAGGVLIVVAVAVILVSALGGGDDSVAAYKDKVSGVMAPVISANKQLSTSLDALHGTNARGAERKVAVAQRATIAARGGLSALTVPKGAEQAALNARQTLTREAAYLDAVGTALANPGSESAAQTQTLAANLTGALDVVAPPGKDWSQSVSGADTLTAWAPHAYTAIKRRAAAVRRARAGRAAASSRAVPAASSSTTSCGGGLQAGPNTSCPFARNVRDAWRAAPGVTNSVRVYSPVTGQTYTMSCAPAGGGITCSGANNASVTWDE